MKIQKYPRFLLLFLLIFFPASAALAQGIFSTPTVTPQTSSPTPTGGPKYIIQAGDSLYDIANRFGVSLSDLLAANNISDANNITAGTQLVIPGLPGITGTLTTETIGYGDTLKSLSRRTQIPLDLLARLNHVTSPTELFAGDSIILPQDETTKSFSRSFSLASGETLLEAAVIEQTDPWVLSTLNQLDGTWAAIPGDILFAPGAASSEKQPISGLPSAFINITVKPLPVIQGGTTIINVETQPGVQVAGSFTNQTLHFFSLDANKFIAMQGVYALSDPGPYALMLTATLPDGTKQTFEQMVVVQAGNYPTDPLLSVSASTLDPATNDAETKQLDQITAPATTTRYWQGQFRNPSFYTDCFTSRFGVRRNYVGGGTTETYHSFHAGLDFCGGLGLPITATADGVVVFAGLLTIHGNTTIIDHGWGIYSMYSHQSEIDVKVGQMVHAGDKIGNVGGTGRVTGPHLHFEIWANGVEVNPMDWLTNIYP